VDLPKLDGTPRHRLVTLGDSLTHGFHHLAICDTDLSYPALIAYELGSYDRFSRPRYENETGGLPLNLEYLARRFDKAGVGRGAFEGAKIIAVSDSHGGVLNHAGVNVEELIAHKVKTGSVAGFPGSSAISSEAVLELPCEILIPAALENQITMQNAERVQARIVAEAANGPTTPVPV